MGSWGREFVGRGMTLCLSVDEVKAYVTNRRSCALDPTKDEVKLYAGRWSDPATLSVALLQLFLADDRKSATFPCGRSKICNFCLRKIENLQLFLADDRKSATFACGRSKICNFCLRTIEYLQLLLADDRKSATFPCGRSNICNFCLRMIENLQLLLADDRISATFPCGRSKILSTVERTCPVISRVRFVYRRISNATQSACSLTELKTSLPFSLPSESAPTQSIIWCVHKTNKQLHASATVRAEELTDRTIDCLL
jgi:hypothetical protein